jgi:hypothetical protein
MFGKINAYLSYSVNALRVYHIQRFPANKLPLWGITFTSLLFASLVQRASWKIKERKLENCHKRS